MSNRRDFFMFLENAAFQTPGAFEDHDPEAAALDAAEEACSKKMEQERKEQERKKNAERYCNSTLNQFCGDRTLAMYWAEKRFQ